MSAYEDIGLSYVSFESPDYAQVPLSNPIETTDDFTLAVKFRAVATSTGYPKILTVGVGSTSGSGGIVLETSPSSGRLTVNHYKTAATDQCHVLDVSAETNLLDGEFHVALIYVPASGTMKAWVDDESQAGQKVLSGAFNSALEGITLNGRVNSATWDAIPSEQGDNDIAWLALYEGELSESDRAALFTNADPRSVGTLRAGDSFWAFDGDFSEANGGTAFTAVGSPTFYLWLTFLNEEATMQDALYDILRAMGYTGSYADMLYAYYNSGD